jgi:hypothetical protein
VWKIDSLGQNTNATANKPKIAVAGGTGAGALIFSRPDAGFTSTTTPAATWPSGQASSINIRKISAAGATMQFDVGTGGPVGLNHEITTMKTPGVAYLGNRVALSMPEAGRFTAELFTMKGQLIYKEAGFSKAGTCILSFAGGKHASGMILGRLTTAGGVRVMPVSLTK